MYRHLGLITRIRNLETIRHVSEVAIRHGFGYFFERHNLWDLVPGRKKTRAAAPMHLGRHLREMLEELGPTYVKFGQMLATRTDIVPPEIAHELGNLQDRVEPLPTSVVLQVLQEELGLPCEEVFLSFAEEPLASASIGQVHAAVLPDGNQVVVKVQRPGARTSIKRDIDLFYQLAMLLKRRLGQELPVDPVQLVDQFASAILRETDYMLEARSASRLRANLANDTDYVIPRTYPHLCTARVLTMERIPGPTLNNVELATLSEGERKRLAGQIARLWLLMVIRDGFFHGDPQPANIVITDDGRVGLVDFGCVDALRLEDLGAGISLFTNVSKGDVHGTKRALRRLGLTWNPQQDVEMEEAIDSLFHRYYGASIAEIDPILLLQDVLAMVAELRLRVPARFLVLERVLVTLSGVLRELDPQFNFFDESRPIAQEMVARRASVAFVASRVSQSLGDYLEVLQAYPIQLRDTLDLITKGDLRINFHHSGLDEPIHRADLVANRIVVAVVTAALALASAIVATFVERGPHVLGLSVWGIPGFLAAIFFGIWLLWAIFRSGRL